MIKTYINTHLNSSIRPDLTISVDNNHSDALGFTVALISQPLTPEVIQVLTEALAKSIAALEAYDDAQRGASDED